MTIPEITSIFTQAGYHVTSATRSRVYVTSKAGVTDATLYKRFRACAAFQIAGYGYDMVAASWYVLYRLQRTEKEE